jgi:hypothetical protein
VRGDERHRARRLVDLATLDAHGAGEVGHLVRAWAISLPLAAKGVGFSDVPNFLLQFSLAKLTELEEMVLAEGTLGEALVGLGGS